jgi:SagB-type dehydrogenase family enzyme
MTVVDQEQKILAHPAIRLRPPGAYHTEKWVVEQLALRTRYELTNSSASILALFFGGPLDVNEACDQLGLILKCDKSFITAHITHFIKLRLLVQTDDSEANRLRSFFKDWSSVGWVAAADYHVATFDYPFLDYAAGGYALDRQRMRAYHESGLDNDRAKHCGAIIGNAGLPHPELIARTWQQVLSRKIVKAKVSSESLFAMLAMTFGKVSEVKIRKGAPIILRTSPSGGGRHPSEGYVVILDVESVDPGWYHYRSDDGCIELVAPIAAYNEIERTFFGAFGRAKFKIQAIVVITSIFKRNMYRYREPRTFRTVHMDVGHLISSLMIFAKTLGVRYIHHSAFDESAVERILGIDPYVEGAMFSIALGNDV